MSQITTSGKGRRQQSHNDAQPRILSTLTLAYQAKKFDSAGAKVVQSPYHFDLSFFNQWCDDGSGDASRYGLIPEEECL